MALITVPDVQFSGFYYPEIYRDLLLYMRRNKEELGLTDENIFEVHVQLVSAFANVGHLNNCRVDVVANELLIDSAKLLESVKRLLKLVGIELASASPATVEILAKLSEVTTSDTTGFIPELAEFATESTPPIPYEVLEDAGIDLDRTDRVSHVFGCQQTKSGTGSVVSGNPDIFTRTAGSTFATTDVGKHIFILEGLNANELRITEHIDNNNVRCIKIPGQGSPAFVSETGISWNLKQFTSDNATAANTDTSYFEAFDSGVDDPQVGDLFYFGHSQVMPSKIEVTLDPSSPADTDIVGAFEYYDAELSSFNPDDVTDNLDGTLTIIVDSLLGTVDRSGASVTVTYLPTQTKETIKSVFAGGNNKITTTTYLGQTSPSEDIADYFIRANWIPFENQADGTNDWDQAGTIEYEFPQDQERNWQQAEVNLEEGWFMRYRVVSIGGSETTPDIDRIKIAEGDQYIIFDTTQGETVGPQTVGTSDGAASQEFTLSETPYIDNTAEVEVEESVSTWVTYTEVANFLSSGETSRHFVLETNAEDEATIRFGDGTNGKIPPVTSDIRVTYRVGGDSNGNVGAGEIASNADGVVGLSSITNPRAAIGWRMKDGGTDEDLERVKRDAPAALRTRDTACTAGDIARLAVNNFTDSDGVKVVARADAFEEAFGDKTAKLMVVGVGGTTLTSSQLEELDEYFNGDRHARPPVYGVLMLNNEVTSVNFEPVLISVNATVTWQGGNAESIKNALLALLTPLALESDNYTYVWDYGGYVSLSRVYSTIHGVSPNIEDIPSLTLNSVASSYSLGDNELPYTTASNIIITIQE